MKAKSHRYTSKDENEKRKSKKTFFQTVSSLIILALSLYVNYSDNPKLEFFKNYIRTSLSVSTDISEAKAYAKNIFDKKTNSDDEIIDDVDISNMEENESVIFTETNNIEYPIEENVPKDDAVPAFRNPTEGEITSPFGVRIHPISGITDTHTGIDIAGNLNQCVISAAEGKVIKCAEDNNNGKYIIVEHSQGYQSAYAHLNEICVIEGEVVDDNTKIGLMGSTGVSTGVHLHFEIKKDNQRLDPEQFVKYNHRG